MRLIRSKLFNVCQHADTECEFPLGITLIKGPNGSGKSNLIKMIKASLTGDFSSNPPPKEANIRHGISEDEKSYIETQWEHTGTKFTVTRGLQKTKNKLVIDGVGEPITKTTEINSMLMDSLLGISKRIVDEFIFVDQWKIFAFMSSTPAVRAKIFSHLCNTEKAERLWEALGTQIKNDSPLLAGVVDTSEAVNQRLVKLNSDIASATAELEAARSQLLSTEQINLLSDITSKTLEYAKFQGLHESYSSDLTQKRKDHEELTAVFAEASTEYGESKELLEQLAEVTRDLSAEEAGLAEILSVFTSNSEFEETLQEPPPTRPEIPAELESEIPELEAMGRELAVVDADISSRQKIVEYTDGDAKCPTCNVDISPGSTHHEHISSELERLGEIRVERARKLQAVQEAANTLRQWQTGYDSWQNARTVAEKSLRTLTPEDALWVERIVTSVSEANPGADYTQISAVKEYARGISEESLEKNFQYRQQLKLFQKQEHAHFELSAKVNSLAKSISDLEDRVEHAQLKMDENKVESDMTPEEAQESLNQHRVASSTIMHTQNLLDTYQQSKQEAEKELATVQELQKRSALAQTWIGDLEYYRDIFHRDALPKVMAQTAMEGMVSVINNILTDDFEAPFYVTAGDNLSFVAHKSNGTSEVAERLSGGEKVILAVAFRLAVNSIFGNDLGMMVLDEPTAGLDGHNIDCLVDLFGRLEESAKSKGRQIIVITHDERLERSCNNVITLSKI